MPGDATVDTESSLPPAPATQPPYKIGDPVAVMGRVVNIIEGDDGFPPGVQIRFMSRVQPVGGASYVPVPLAIVRKTDEELE